MLETHNTSELDQQVDVLCTPWLEKGEGTPYATELEEDVRLSQAELGLISWAPSSLGLIMHCK
jgi:hypothetical protein